MVRATFVRSFCGAVLALALGRASANAEIDLGATPPNVDPTYIKQIYRDAIAKGEDKVSILAGDRYFVQLHQFTDRFPGLSIANAASLGPERAPLALTQYRADKMEFDLIQGTGGVLSPLVKAGVLTKIDYSSLGYPIDDQIAGLAIYADSVMVNAYNPNVVRKEDLPRTLDDFNDAHWQGRLTGDPFSYASGWAFLGTLNGEKDTLQRALNTYDKSDIVLSGAAMDLVNRGEKSMFVFANLTRVLQGRKAGNSIDMNFVDGLGVGRFGMSVTSRAPHPNAAKLFLYWIHTPEGQAALFDASSVALAKNVKSPISDIVDKANVKFIFETDQNWQERGRLTNVFQKALVRKR